MLIPLGDRYVNPDHIIEVVPYPTGKNICVILTEGREIRLTVNQHETATAALARVVAYIKAELK